MASSSDEDRRTRLETSMKKLLEKKLELKNLEATLTELKADFDAAKHKNPAVNNSLPGWKEWKWTKDQMEAMAHEKDRFDAGIKMQQEAFSQAYTAPFKMFTSRIEEIQKEMSKYRSCEYEGEEGWESLEWSQLVAMPEIN